jgi:tetratricopeptide (TPR) repeat protein
MKLFKSLLPITAALFLPVSITAQARHPVLKIDGKENPDVYLQSLDIQVDVTGNIASTRYTMVFKSKANRVLEGELTFPLPDGRSVTHYALDVNGKMREAVPVEKARATQVFEEIEQRPLVVDPGVLERVEGNNFRTRIYPIMAKGTRTVSIGYEEELEVEKEMLRYNLPMAYPNPIEKFAVTATVWKTGIKPLVSESEEELRFDATGENYVASFSRKNYRPSRALIFSLPAPNDIPRVMMQPAQGSHYFLAAVAPKLETRKKVWDNSLAIIWDVSLSGTQRDLKRELEALDVIFAEKKNAGVQLYFLNNGFKKIVNKNAIDGAYDVTDGKWDDLKKTLEAAVFDGGTDFSQIKLDSVAGNEILFFSDGISTLSDADFLKKAKPKTKRPIHCLVSAVKADYSVMRLIAGRTNGKFININVLSAENLKSELLNETPRFLGTEHGNTIREIYPDMATPIQGNFSLAGISDANSAELTLLFGFGAKVEKRVKVKLDAQKAGRLGNVHKIWAQKKIAELDLNYENNRDDITELGRQFGIVTRNTSLIVLETVNDYIRYKITPPAELLAEYQHMQKRLEERQRDTERDLLKKATAAADEIKKWWKTKFIHKKTKYPTPDKDGDEQNDTDCNCLKAGALTRSDGDENFNGEVDELISGQSQGSIVGPKQKFHGSVPAGKNGAPAKSSNANGNYKKEERAASNTSKASGSSKSSSSPKSMAFESSEVMAYLDNPAPVYIPDIDIDVPNADAITIDRNSSRSTPRGVNTGDGYGYGAGYGSGFGGGGGAIDDETAARLLSKAAAMQKGKNEQPVIRIKPVKKDNDYLNKLTGNVAEDYQLYLKLRGDYAGSPAFYFDMAEWFHARGDKETALRVLTSIAELELKNASLYRLLGYRFKEYGEYALEKFVCFKVTQWRPMEPQSYRDYALALADNGETQAALDSLYSLLTKTYSENIGNRSQGIEEVVITEINRLAAQNAKINKSKTDKRLFTNVAVDVRVVINWNMNNTDIDLHVVDPYYEECYYRHRKTDAGGRISADNRDGYGPEQFLLKEAAKGKYRVYVNYYGDRQFTQDGPSTVMAEIYTKYAGTTEQRRVVCLQMSNAKKMNGKKKDKVMLAEFEF